MLDFPFIDYLRELNMVSLIVRYILAILCGGLIGIERELKHRPAGFRTHILVCVGAATVCILGQYLVEVGYATDISRMGAQVVSGIGFLGAGTIIVTRRQQIKGLTTAAALWASACIGMAVGAGFYEGAIVGTGAIYLIVAVLVKVNHRMLRESSHVRLYIEFRDSTDIGNFINEMKKRNIHISSIDIDKNTEGRMTAVVTELLYPDEVTPDEVVSQIENIDGIFVVEHL